MEYEKKDIDELVLLCIDLLGWLNTQRGMLVKDYAKDLAKILTVIESKRAKSACG